MPVVELVGAYEGIKFAVEVLQANKIWVEGDSSVVVHWLKAGEGPGHFVNALLSDIRTWLSRLAEWQVTHVYREGNKPANWIANEGKNRHYHFFSNADDGSAVRLSPELVDLLNWNLKGSVYNRE